jgi:hypothetical protein
MTFPADETVSRAVHAFQGMGLNKIMTTLITNVRIDEREEDTFSR